ncbi:helix-turn-helix domain-containing protein [Planctomycetota bacterium]
MPTARRVAVMVDLDEMAPRQRAALRGVRRFAAEHPEWQIAIDPYAAMGAAGSYDGIIALAHAAKAANEPPTDTPVVAVSHAGWHRRTLSRVLPNLRTAGRLAAAQLLKCGFSRYAFLGYCPDLASRLLREGYAAKIRRAGLHLAHLLFSRHVLTRRRGWATLADVIPQWLETDAKPPVGVFVCSAALARCLADLCLRKGLAIPDDVAILCPDAEPDVVEFPPPSLSTIDLGYEPCGHRAAELLEELMETGSTVPHRVLLPPGEIAPRRSTDVVAWHDPVIQRACRHIADHCHQPLRVADVAEAVGVSLRELQRRFKRLHPLSLVGEIAYARLRRARRLLLGTELSVDEVARRAGLASGRHLAKLLRKADGMSPSEFRRVRPQPQRAGEPDLAKAKYLMATTELPMATIAYDSGYRRHRYLIEAFHRDVGETPRAWRKRHRQPRPQQAFGPVTITFIGPDGEIEEQTTYDPDAQPTAEE